jgi:predicted dehydrogenase
MQPIRLGVIGLGLIWIRTHKPILTTMPDAFEPIAFCDLSEERRAAVAQEFPGAQIYSDDQSLLQHPEIEAVLVLTPIALNAPTALAALKAGKHVFMEKPIARSAAEGQELIETARRAGKRLFVTEQFAYRTNEETLAGLIDAGEIGDLIMWHWVQHLEADPAQGPLRYDTTPWRKAADFPLGALFDGGIHLIAGLTKLFGQPESVFATGRQLRPEYGEYDQVAMMFHYASGLTGMLSHSSYLPPLHNHFHIHGTQGLIVVERNRLVVEKPGGSSQVIDLPAENSYARMWQALAAAYRDNRDPYYTAERALADVALLEMVNRSIKSGETVRWERFGA